MLRRLLISILLVVLPLQGFAAVNPAHCLQLQHDAHPHAGHHEQGVGVITSPHAGHHHDAAGAGTGTQSAIDHASHHHRLTCCDNLAAVPGPVSAAGSPAVFGSPAAAEYKRVLTSVFLEGPQRPPTSFLV
ncbi:MAG TPA: hypothetical protein VN361_07215 [Oxalicibacterium sp.]|nr:hypothetical protein [Oxalicibacterium sp.]